MVILLRAPVKSAMGVVLDKELCVVHRNVYIMTGTCGEFCTLATWRSGLDNIESNTNRLEC